MLLPISSIRRDGGTQPRSEVDRETLEVYAEAMEAGAKFPPVVVFYDGTDYWLADGFHRVEATDMMAGVNEIECEVHQGTVTDAQWYSYSANQTHGLRRTNKDKQRAVKAALAHPSGAGLSDSQIAKHVGVDHKTVAAYRSDLGISQVTRTGTDGRTINTANIGKRPQTPDGGTRVTLDAAPPRDPEPVPRPARPDSPAPRRTGELEAALSHVWGVLECEATPNELRPLLRAEQRTPIADLLLWCQDMLKEEE